MINADLYRRHILDHAQNPRHAGTIPAYSFKVRRSNPLCGDDIELYAMINAEGIVTALSFIGEGCVISRAAASLFCEAMHRKSLEEATESFMLELIGIPLNPARRLCALLPLHAFQKGLITTLWKKP